MQYYLIGYAVLTGLAILFCRGKAKSLRPLSWPATLFFVAATDVLVGAANVIAQRLSDRIFVRILYGIGEIRRPDLRIAWSSRVNIVLSNGEKLGRGASSALQLITFLVWGILLLIGFLAVRYLLKRVYPPLYAQYSLRFRQWMHEGATDAK